MKYKALIAIVLLLLPLAPLAIANQPPWNVELRIRPGATKYWGPCVVSTEFPIDVYLWNDKTLTNVGVYAYDFYVYWKNNVGISLVDFVNHIPWPSGSYFLVANETGIYAPDTTFSFYHLAVTAIGNSTLNPALELGATGIFNASLVTLTFHIDSEPCWPGSVETGFWIGNDLGAYLVNFWTAPYPGMSFPVADPNFYPKVSTGCTPRIWNLEVDNGHYSYGSSQPNIDPLVPTDDPGYVNASAFKTVAIGESHTIMIALSNITHAYGFKFTLTWDSAWYDYDIQHVTLGTTFAPPYETVTMSNTSNSLTVELKRPCEKPGIHAAGYTPVVYVTFVTKNPSYNLSVPYNATTYFSIPFAELYVKCDTITSYVYPDLFYSGDVIQMVRPKSRADLNLDGIVDIEDLAEIAQYYGLVHPWSALVDPQPPAPVDIFDLVYVAKRYGDP